jgi:hypothetical protein
MSNINKQRVAAVATLQALGYTYSLADGWSPLADAPGAGTVLSSTEADAMHGVLMRRADALQGCTEGSPEEIELKTVTDAIEAYETQRWPEGKEAGGEG